MTNEAGTFVRTIAGRDITLRHVAIGQLLVAQRLAIRLKDQAEAEADTSKRVDVMSKLVVATLDLVESLIVNPEDVEFIEDQMLKGKVDYQELMTLIVDESKDTKATKRTAAKPKTAKTVASRGRTKR